MSRCVCVCVCVCVCEVINQCIPLSHTQSISFVFSGYDPLSVRLLEVLDKPNGWTQFEEVMLSHYQVAQVVETSI